jgi:hypothetical protein
MRSSLRQWRWFRALALVPAAALLGAPYIADRLEPRIFGLPPLLAWIVLWVLLASVTMGVIGWLDGQAERDEPVS